MPWLLLKLLGIGKWLKEALSGFFGLICQYPLQAALIASLCLSGWLWRGRQAAIAERDIQHTGWVNEIRGRNADRKAYNDAQKEAERKQAKADQDNLSGQLAANRELDKAHAELETARAGAVADYLRAHRLPAQAACRPSSGASATNLPDNPATPDSGRAASDLVAVKPADIDAWSKVEVQNADRGNFIRGLIAQGLAVEGE